MKIAILSDIHGNLEALKKCLNSIGKKKVDKIICLGDVIGYGIDGEECYNILKKLNCDFIIGNHEAMYLDFIDYNDCSDMAKKSLNWQKKNIKIDLNSINLKHFIKIEDCFFVHSCFGEYGYKKYLNKLDDILKEFKEKHMVFYGHTHRPRITIIRNGEIIDHYIKKSTSFIFNKSDRVYINIGSVGQQRDNVTDASFSILDLSLDSIKVDVYRIKYNSLTTFIKLNRFKDLNFISRYLIRENWRRKLYVTINYWWNWLYR